MKNIILIGFMGTGKTSTGKILANRIGYAFADMDQRIERKYGMSIKEMFEKKGEPYFRACEKSMANELSVRKNMVISTGGGTAKNPENMAVLKANGVIICLQANVDSIMERTGRRGTRPVLDEHDQGDRRQAIQDLLDSRQSIYTVADYFVDTSELSPMEVANDIIHYLKREGVLHA